MTQRLDALPSGYILDRYSIEGVLGDGGFGITYLACHTSMGDKVAIKEFFPVEFAMRDTGSTVLPRGGKTEDTYQWGLARFLDEAKTLTKFKDHPNIVSVRDFFEKNGTAYMVMQYEKGETLEQWLQTHPYPTQQQLLDIFIPILDGLREIHSQHYLHRDIKPGNIYIRNDGRPLLIDFGASRLALGDRSHSLTNIITPGYSPKEQYTSTGSQGAWTDVYAVGATLWRAISGMEPVIAGDRGNARDDGQPDPLVSAMRFAGRGGYSETFLRAIDSAVAYLPKDRPQTARDFQNMLLGEWKEGGSGVVGQGSSGWRVVNGDGGHGQGGGQSQPMALWKQWSLVGAIILGLVLAGKAFWGGKAEDKPMGEASTVVSAGEKKPLQLIPSTPKEPNNVAVFIDKSAIDLVVFTNNKAKVEPLINKLHDDGYTKARIGSDPNDDWNVKYGDKYDALVPDILSLVGRELGVDAGKFNKKNEFSSNDDSLFINIKFSTRVRIVDDGKSYSTLNNSDCVSDWPSPEIKKLSGSSGWNGVSASTGDQGELVEEITHCNDGKIYLIKVQGIYLPIGKSGVEFVE